MSDQSERAEDPDYDVVVVGGGPAGCSAGIFTARYGFETVIFDSGNAALRRSAFLANYPGFPAGIDIDTFYDLLHGHAAEAGCPRVEEMVVAVDQSPAGEEDTEGSEARFAVETQLGRVVTARYVIAAAWYDGEYLRPVCGQDAFEMQEHHGEREERFDPDYPDEDGRTPIYGLYVAAPGGLRNEQAIISAGHGAHVARTCIEDNRRAQGYPEGVISRYYDWLRPESEFSGEWADRDRWRTWFENELSDDHEIDPETLADLREDYIDRAFETKLSPDEIDHRCNRAHQRLVEHIDDDVVLDRAREIQSERATDDADESSAPEEATNDTATTVGSSETKS